MRGENNMFRLLVSFLLVFSVSAFSAERSIGRYTIAETQASKAQRFPLIEVRTSNIPSTIMTNREAVDFLLMSTGYSQASDSVRTPQDKALMRKHLALSNRDLVNLTILEMLSIVAGIGYVPVVDPINRLVAFEAVYEFKQ